MPHRSDYPADPIARRDQRLQEITELAELVAHLRAQLRERGVPETQAVGLCQVWFEAEIDKLELAHRQVWS